MTREFPVFVPSLSNTCFISAVSSSDKWLSPTVLGLEGNFDITLCLSTLVSGIIDNLDLLEPSLLEEVMPLDEPPRYPELPPENHKFVNKQPAYLNLSLT